MNKQFYFKQFSLAWVKVKWLLVLLSIGNSSIKYQSFIYTLLNDQTVLFLTIQNKRKSFVCTQLECQTVLFDP